MSRQAALQHSRETGHVVNLTSSQRRHLQVAHNDAEIVLGGLDATPNVRRSVVHRLCALGLLESVTPSTLMKNFYLLLILLLTGCGLSRSETINAVRECEAANLKPTIVFNYLTHKVTDVICLSEETK